MADISIKDVRAKFPQYADMSDDALADALHRKYYADVPREVFMAKIGMGANAAPAATEPAPEAPQQPASQDGAKFMGGGFMDVLSSAMTGAGELLRNASQVPQRPEPPAATVPVAPAQNPAALPQPASTLAPTSSLVPKARPVQATAAAPTQPDPMAAISAAMGGQPAAPYVEDAMGAPRAPVDPFAGETFGDLAKRRGQQAAAGATDVIASVPEALAIADAEARRNMVASFPPEIQALMGEAETIRARLADPATANHPARPVWERALAETEAQIIEYSTALDQVSRSGNDGGGMDSAASRGRAPLEADNSANFQRGDEIRKASADTFGAPDPRDQGFWSKVASGAGNAAGFATAGIAGSVALGPVGGLAVGGGAGAAMNSSQLYKEAKAAGADEETATKAAKLGGVIGLGEIIPINRALNLLPPRLRGEMTKGFMRKLVDIGQSAGEEAAQEYLSQVANNMVAQGLYDPERGWTEGATEAAVVGAILGGGMGAVGVAAEGRSGNVKPKDKPQPTPAPEKTVAPPAASAPAADPVKDALAAAMGAPAAPQADQATPAPVEPQPAGRADAPSPQAAAPQGATITQAEAEANPDRYEVMPETEGQGQDARPTGRMVAIDNQTGTPFVVVPDQTTAKADGATGQGGKAGEQQQASSATDQGPTAPPAADAQPTQPAAPAPVEQKSAQDTAPAFEVLDEAALGKVQTDAKTFQYKDGGDESGVTDRLRGVTAWDQTRAGMSLIYEDRNGNRYVADGHQRLGLAKRLSGQGQNVRLPAMIIKEADGISPQQARVIAALKNIAEGSGTPIDAAKVMRDSNKTVQELGLPPSSALVRDAAGLSKLSDHAFGMVVNGAATEQHGAIVGRVVQDQTAQANILGLLAKLKPANAFQAEAIARQAADATTTETQADLFGTESVAANLYLERAKILDAAFKRVRGDLKTFKTLVDRAETVSSAGNVLNADANQQRLATDRAVSDYLATQANMKGPISDALTAAARSLKSGGKPAAVVSDFLADVERRLGQGGDVGPTRGEDGQASQLAGAKRSPETEAVTPEPAGTDPEAASGDLFAPTTEKTDAGTQTVIPGAEASQAQAVQAASTKAQAEADVRAAQSKIGTTKPQGDAGPLFDTQSDLFSAPKKEPQKRLTGTELSARGEAVLADYRKDNDDQFEAQVKATDMRSKPEGKDLLERLAAVDGLAARSKVSDEWVLERGRATGVEHLVVLDKDGIPLAVMKGQRRSVTVFPSVFRAAEAGIFGHVTHNHPASTGHSAPDISMMAHGFGPMTVVAHDGRVSVVRLADGVTVKVSARYTDGAVDQTASVTALEQIRKRVFDIIRRDLTTRRGMTQTQADVIWDRVTRDVFPAVMDRMGVIAYDHSYAAILALEADGFNFEDIYGQVSGNGADRLRRAGFVFTEGGNHRGNQTAGSGAAAAPSRSDSTDRKPADDGSAGDGSGRLPPVKATTGNADMDAALDDIFGSESDVSGPGGDMERGGGDRSAADGMGGTDVSPAAGRSERGTGGGRKPSGTGSRKPRRGAGISGSDAAPMGSGSDPAVSGTGGAGGQSADAENGGRRNGGGAGGSSLDQAGSGNSAGNAPAGTGSVKRTPAQQLAAIRAALKEDIPDFVARGAGATASPAFRKWFGASKVVDDSGNPLVVYHGTAADFEAFDPSRAGSSIDSGFLGAGIYMTNLPRVADYYAEVAAKYGPGQNVMPLYVSLQNPFMWGRKTFGVRDLINLGTPLPDEVHQAVIEKTGFEFDPNQEPDYSWEPVLSSALTAVLQEKGYDGVIASSGTDAIAEIVAFSPTQIKSVFNRGTWDGSNPAMLAETATDLDPRTYDMLASVFDEATADMDLSAMPMRDALRAMIRPLAAEGMTREEVAAVTPYFLRYHQERLDGRRQSVEPAPKPIEADDRAEQQAKADRIKPVLADLENIRASLPLLLPEQQEDVFKIETRFAQDDGDGMLITNGTGTGKTYSGAGTVKRFVRRGKGNVLIVGPSEAVLRGWQRALADLGVDAMVLPDTKSAGQGVTLTTYANLEQNNALASRSWDLIVPDESHNLMSNAAGTPTGALDTVRALSHRSNVDLARKSHMIHADEWAAFKAMPTGEAKTRESRRLYARQDAEVARWSTEPRAKVLFLSASPFAYPKCVDYAEGYLFRYPEDGRIGNSNQSGRNLFMVRHLGYRIRYHKLTEPDAAVDQGVFQRDFHEKLKRDGVLSGRSLQVDVDYDRRFVATTDSEGSRIDEAVKLIDAARKAAPTDELKKAYSDLLDHHRRVFDYLHRAQLLEAIKARAAIRDAEKHLAMGRKVVVFHDYNKGGGFHPFTDNSKVFMTAEASAAWAAVSAQHPWMRDLNFAGYLPPVEAFQQHFGDRVKAFNGTVPKKKRLENLDAFNRDGSGVDILVVQADAGGAGISMHDVTGNHQRALLNLGLPAKPVTVLQEEGRILRVGSKTDAIFRYYTIGTEWERFAFAQRVAQRTSAVENLALGNEARDLRDAFIQAYLEAEAFDPSEADGKGGKAKHVDRATVSAWDRAVAHYFGRMKVSGRRDQRDGVDFYPTPEPLALKLVEWAGLRPNERVLEPSAGDGAIARYFPDDVDVTLIEPSSDLGATALLRAPGAKLVNGQFEDYHVVNKHHAIVMNPPFGAGGKTAYDHVEKALTHLRPGGRLVAIVPTGPAADKQFEKRNWPGVISTVILPDVTFQRAGTSVRTRVLIIDTMPEGLPDKDAALADAWSRAAYINLGGSATIEQFFDRLRGITVPRRPAPVLDVVEELEAEGEQQGDPARAPRASAPLATSVGTLEKTTVTSKSGKAFPAVAHAARVERDLYAQMQDVAKAHGGWWHKAAGKRNAGPTFAFRTEAARDAFLDDMQKPVVAGLAETAYHGTPHDFDQFSLGSIGTGEGAQAYGWGLYFAGSKKVAEWYRDKLSNPDPTGGWGVTGDYDPNAGKGRGRLFQVEIPETNDLLDWDAPLSEQPEAVHAALFGPSGLVTRMRADESVGEYLDDHVNDDFEGLLGRQFYTVLKRLGEQDLLDYTLPGVNEALEQGRTDQAASLVLHAAGITGHRYLDGNSRSAGEGSHNYVIYDDKAISIIRKEQRAQMTRDARAATDVIRRAMPDLRAELDRLDLKRVNLVHAPQGTDWQGYFHVTGDGTLEIVIGASMNPMKTLHHEVIHALRTMNLFTPEEWRALETAAAKGWMEQHDIAARYPDLTEAERIEEAIAEEFSEALAAKRSPKGSLLVNAFNKIARIFRAFRTVMTGKGYKTVDDIFGAVLGGEISARNAYNTGLGWRMGVSMQARWHAAMSLRSMVKLVWDGAKPDTPIVVGDLPPVLRAISGKSNKLVVSASVIRKAGNHGLTQGDVVAALEGLGSPVMVFDSANETGNLTVLVRTPAADGRSIVVAVDTEFTAGKVSVSNIATIHGKNEDASIIGWMTKGYLRYIDKGKAGEWSRSRGRQLPKDMEIKHRLGLKILQHRDVFKPGTGLNEGDPKFQRRPMAVRPLTPQGRAHRNTGMQGSIFIPDRRVWEALTQAGAPIWQRLRDGGRAATDAVDRGRFMFQDRFLPILRAQEAIVRQTGKPLAAEQNAYITETTFSGKVGKRLFDIDQDFTKPIIRLMAATDGALTTEEVGTWLYARHAIERNARIAAINPAMPDGGSGMTDAEAKQVLDEAKAGPHALTLEKIGALIDVMRDRTLTLREDAGLITHEEARMWRTMYRHYVPLKGFADTDHSEAVLDMRGGLGAKRLNVRGAETQRALGRGSEAFNPLVAALTQAQEVAVRAEKNMVAASLYKLARDFPAPALWSVKQPKQKRYFNRTTGLVETRVEDPVSMILEPNEMALKVDGQEVRILFHDERVARAAGTIGADQMNAIIRVLSICSRFFSLTRTMLNPEFMLTNAFRDFQTAQFNIQAFGEKDKNAIALAIAKNWRKAFMGAWRGSHGDYSTPWAKSYEAFQKSGAQISFWTMEDPTAQRVDLDHRINLARGNKAERALKVILSPKAFFSMRDNAVLDFIDRTNLAVDNAIRLAAFTEAKRLGWKDEDAAFLAKELTVNFNRRGEVGGQMNAFYPFFNAAIQGAVRTGKAVTSKRVAKLVLFAIAVGMINDLVNAMLSERGDDDELLYDKIPDWKSQRAIHFVGWGTGENPAAIPMSYGYNVFPYIGQQMGKVARGVKSPQEAFASVAQSIFGAFSPIQGGDAMTTAAPFFADPFIELAENKDWTGAPIYPRFPKEGVPDSQVFNPSATEASKSVAETLNGLTGGDFRTPGLVDVSPETLDHLASFIVGSAGAFFGRTGDLVAKAAGGNFDEIEAGQVPFLRNVMTKVGPWIDRERYYRFRAEVRDAAADKKAYEAAGMPVPPATAKKAALYDASLEAEREMNGKGDWNPTKANAKKPRDETAVYLDFNGKFIKAMGSQAE